MSFSCVTCPSCDDLRCINSSVLPSVSVSFSSSCAAGLFFFYRFSLVCSLCPFIPQFKTPNSSKVQSASWNTPINDMRPIQDVLGSTNIVLKAVMGNVRLRQAETFEAFVPSWRCCSVKRGHRRAQHSSQHNYRHTINQFSQTEQTAVFTVISTHVYSCLLATCFAPSCETLDALCWFWGFLGVCVIRLVLHTVNQSYKLAWR